MQPTDKQVACSLAALRRPHTAGESDRGRTNEVIPFGLLDELLAEPSIRPERLAEARARIDAGDRPTNDDLANRMVGRLVCDRLR